MRRPPVSRKTHVAPEPLDGVALLFRLLALVREQPAQRPLRRRDIAGRLEVAERTLTRYLGILRTHGLVEHTRGGGYRLTADARRFPLPGLAPEEAMALAFLAAVAPRLDLPYAREMGMALRAATAGLAPSLHRTMRRWADAVTVQDRHAPPVPDTVLHLMGAIASGSTVEVDYESRQSGRALRRLDPYGLDFSPSGHFVHGWCHRNKALRTFSLAAVHGLVVTNDTFERDEAAWETFRGASGVVGGLRGGPQVEVDVLFDPEAAHYARRASWPAGLEIVEEEGGAVALRGVAQGTAGIVPELLRWRRLARVRGGSELLAAMREEVEAMARVYRLLS